MPIRTVSHNLKALYKVWVHKKDDWSPSYTDSTHHSASLQTCAGISELWQKRTWIKGNGQFVIRSYHGQQRDSFPRNSEQSHGMALMLYFTGICTDLRGLCLYVYWVCNWLQCKFKEIIMYFFFLFFFKWENCITECTFTCPFTLYDVAEFKTCCIYWLHYMIPPLFTVPTATNAFM